MKFNLNKNFAHLRLEGRRLLKSYRLPLILLPILSLIGSYSGLDLFSTPP